MDEHVELVAEWDRVPIRAHTVDDFIALVREVGEVLARETDLSPANEAVTAMIDRLKHRLRMPYTPAEIQSVLRNEHIRRLHRELLVNLSEAESQTELFDARQLCRSGQSGLDMITRLSYWGIYEALVSRELDLLRRLSREQELSDAPAVFVGSGPLPLSAILLRLYSHMEVICLEIDAAACETSRALLHRLGLEEHVVVLQQNGASFDYSPYRSVFVASLVTNKLQVLEQIRRTRPDALVAVRTAEGMRQLMYETLDETLLQARGWDILERTSPQEGLVINSTLFMKHHALSSSL